MHRYAHIAPRVFDSADADSTTMRQAAYAIAVERIAAAISARGDTFCFKV